MPRYSAPSPAPRLGFTLHAGRFGFGISVSGAPFTLKLVHWTRGVAPEPYRLRGRARRLGALRWIVLRESVPGPRP